MNLFFELPEKGRKKHWLDEEINEVYNNQRSKKVFIFLKPVWYKYILWITWAIEVCPFYVIQRNISPVDTVITVLKVNSNGITQTSKGKSFFRVVS